MKTTIPKGTKYDDMYNHLCMDDKQVALYNELCLLEEELTDWLGSLKECIAITIRNGLHYDITADLEDIKSFLTIVRRQSARFYNEVTWGTGEE